MILGFDEANVLGKTKSIPFEEYFGQMDLTEEQKEERIELAEEIKDVLLFLFLLIDVYREHIVGGEYGLSAYKENITMQFKNRYNSILKNNSKLDEYLSEYIDLYAAEVVETTIKHIDDAYYTSNDRAMFNAENEANSVKNYTDYRKAVENGKTKKKWIDMMDKRERKTHLKVGGTILPINEPFVVGDSLMLFPKDLTYNPSPNQYINCRCSIKYL